MAKQPVRLPLGRLAEHRPEHPERTAYQAGRSWDSLYTVREWPSVGAMRTACRMSDTGKLGANPWKPWPEKWRG